jgi:hypothetical protein
MGKLCGSKREREEGPTGSLLVVFGRKCAAGVFFLHPGKALM